MVYLVDLRHADPVKFDEIWLVVRSVGKAESLTRYSNVKHVPELSPSTNLFFQYRKWAKNGKWTRTTFRNRYVPQFLRDADPEYNTDFHKAMLELAEKSETKDIALACFCKDEAMCHRSILGAICIDNDIPIERPDVMETYQREYGTDYRL